MNGTKYVRVAGAGCMALALAWAGPAVAQESEGWELEEELAEDDFEPEEEEEEDTFKDSEPLVPKVDDSAWSPVEKEGTTYLFVGARYRAIAVPRSFVNLFVDGGSGLFVHSAGVEFGMRRNNFEIIPSLWFAKYSVDNVPFKGKNDGPDAWEMIDANLSVLYLTADFLWSTPITPELAVNYGAGAGIGLVLGDITRHEAYFPGGLDPDGAGLRRCSGPGNPPGAGVQCPDIDGQYNFTQSAWPVFPWLAIQTGLRYKPHKSFVARLDLGLSTSGVFFGLGLDYGL